MRAVAVKPIHLEHLKSWLVLNACPVPNEFPKYGWIAYEKDVPIATAFLRRVEGGYAQLDGLATDPRLPGELRHKAIDMVVQKVLKKAKSLGISHVMAISVDAGTLMRSKKHGFVQLPHSFIAVDLNKAGVV